MMTAQQWASCVMALRSAFPNTMKLDAAGIAFWKSQLDDLPAERVQAAIVHMARTQDAFPTIAAIRRHAQEQEDHSAAYAEACRHVTETSTPSYRLVEEGIQAPRVLDWPAPGQYAQGGYLEPRMRLEQQAPPELDPATRETLETFGVEAIRERKPETEGTLRAQWRGAFEARREGVERRKTFNALGEGRRALPPGAMGIIRELPGGGGK